MKRGRFLKRSGRTERTVDLVGGNLKIPDTGLVIAAVLIAGIEAPVCLCRVQHNLGADDVGIQKDLRVGDAAVHMTFRGEIDHGVNGIRIENPVDRGSVADVRVYKMVSGIVFNILEVLKITGIGQSIDIDDGILRVFFAHQVDKVASDKSGAAGYQHGSLHMSSLAMDRRYCPYSVIFSSSPSSISLLVGMNPRRHAISSMQEM